LHIFGFYDKLVDGLTNSNPEVKVSIFRKL